MATSWEDEWESEEVVSSLVDELVVSAEEAIAQKALRAAVVPYTVDSVFAKMRAAIECRFVDHDAGEPEVASASNWSVGEEPVPALIDAWSRGAVPAKKPAPISQPAAESAGGSRSVSEPPRSPRAKTPLGSERGERVPDSLPLPDPKGPVFIAKPLPGQVVAKPKKAAPIVTAAEKLRRRLDAEAREDKAKLAQLEQDLKARQFTYAAPSNVIVLEEMQPDRLPPFQQQPRLGLSGQPPAHAPAAAPARAGKGAKGKGAKGGAKRGSAVEFGGTATFKQLDSLQPPLLESMNVGAGVLLKQGEGTKGGEARVFDGERLSKTVFEQMLNNPMGFPRRPVAVKEDDPAGGAADPSLGNTGEVPPPTPLGQGGQPPAVRPPHMPNSPGPEDKFGARNALTRERGGMPIKNRLPPPALGATTGHGQGVPYCGQQLTASSQGVAPALTASETLRVTNAEALRMLED